MTPIQILILLISILFFSGCSGEPPFGGGSILPGRQIQIIETTDFEPLSKGLEFVGICSVVCSTIWGASLIITANIKRKSNR